MTVSHVANHTSAATNTDKSSYDTANSVTPTAVGNLLIATFAWGRASNLSDAWSSISGTLAVEDEDGNPGWTLIEDAQVPNNNTRVAMFYGYATDTVAGTVLLNFPASQGNGSWKVTEWTATDGIARVDLVNVATLSSSPANPTITLPDPVRSGSAMYSLIGHNSTTQVMTEPATWTEVGGRLSATSPSVSHSVAWIEDPASVPEDDDSITWTVAGTAGKALVLAEIYDYVAPSGGPTLYWHEQGNPTLIPVTGLKWHEQGVATDVDVTNFDWHEQA